MSSMSRNAARSCSLVKSGTGPAMSSPVRRWTADGTADLLVATAIWLLKKRASDTRLGPTPISRNRASAKAHAGRCGWHRHDPLLPRLWAQGCTRGRSRPLKVRPLELEHQVMGVHIVQQRTGALIEQVGVEALGLEERDPPLPERPLRIDRREFPGELGDLLVDVLPGIEAVIAREGVDPKIAHQKRGGEVEAKRCQNRSKPPAGDHRGRVPLPP